MEEGSAYLLLGDRLTIDKCVISRSYSFARQRPSDIRSDMCTHVWKLLLHNSSDAAREERSS